MSNSPRLFAAPIEIPGAEPRTVREVITWSKRHPAKWLVPNLIIQEGVHILHGLEESFKTMLMLQLHEALANGGQFLAWKAEGGHRTGIAELEMKMQMSGSRFSNFWPNADAPEIYVLPESARRDVLGGKSASDRIGVIVSWAKDEALEFISIDSLAKLFPPGNDPSRQDLASDIFSQIQLLPTALILAHDRKSHDPKGGANNEIVGSGRMAQEPDVIHQVVRTDRRAPIAELTCGKMREGEKPQPLRVYFDKVDFRLYPYHPFLHLLPATEQQLIAEAECRYGWKPRNSRTYIQSLMAMPGIDTEQQAANRSKRLSCTLSLDEFGAALEDRNSTEEEDAATPSTSPGT